MDPTTDTAASAQNAVDQDSEARPQSNAPFPDDAPQTYDSFEAEADDEEQSGGPTQDDRAAEADALRQELEQMRSQQTALQAQAQHAAHQQALAAWQQGKWAHDQQTSGMDAYEKAQADRQFFENREAQLLQAMQQGQIQTQQYQQFLAVQQQAQGLVAKHGLDQEDADALMALGAMDPARMHQEATRLAAKKRENAQLEKRLAKIERSTQRDQRVASGAERVGGGGGPLPGKGSFEGTIDELADLFNRDPNLRSLLGR